MASETLEVGGPVRRPGGRTRQYAPVATVLLLILFIALAVLPSSLNLPQSNPSTILEYAPVPPDSNVNPPPASSGLSSLGIASTDSLTSELTQSLTDKLDKTTRRQISKKCIGNRQTEDPNAPDCQAFFVGDNGGATYKLGVTKDEVTVVFYQQAVITTDGQRTEQSPGHRVVCDVDLMDCNGDGKTDEDPHVWIRVANAFVRYFNGRYQTYGRHIKAYFYWSQSVTESGRRGDAADIYTRFKPFAIIDHAWNGGFHEEFTDSATQRGMMVFSSLTGSPRPRSFYQKYQPLAWTYWPDVENWVDMFTGYLCNKIAGTKVRGGQFAERDRIYGFYYTRDAGFPSYRDFKDLVKERIKDCPNGPIVAGPGMELAFPYAGWAVDTQGDQSYGQTNVATWQGGNVNTVIWFGGAETKTSAAADQQGWEPEWILAGDGLLEANAYGQIQGQKTWSNAWAMSYQLASSRRQEAPDYMAYKEAEPNGQDDNWAAGDYRPWFLLFTAIQTAGPRLNPDGVNRGLHAVQKKRSTSPTVAACFYFPGDFTCVKDAAEMWYDSTGITPGGSQGCYRLVNEGIRWPADEWGITITEGPNAGKGSKDAGQGSPAPEDTKDPNRDPCGGYDSAQGIRPGTPGAPGT